MTVVGYIPLSGIAIQTPFRFESVFGSTALFKFEITIYTGSPISFLRKWEAGVFMDADHVILLAQCLINRARPVYTFTIVY